MNEEVDLNDIAYRRATVDDIEALSRLWQHANLDVAELEKRLTDFQIAEAPTGDIIAAIGLHTNAQQGRMHSEAYLDEFNIPVLRPKLFERIKNVAQNYGLIRIWTLADPAWTDLEFREPNPEEMEAFPPGFGNWKADWRVLKLREDIAAADRIAKEMELFRITNQEENSRIIKQAKVMKFLAISISIVLFVIVALGLFIMVTKSGTLGR